MSEKHAVWDSTGIICQNPYKIKTVGAAVEGFRIINSVKLSVLHYSA